MASKIRCSLYLYIFHFKRKMHSTETEINELERDFLLDQGYISHKLENLMNLGLF